eukprot:TRINITY_DN1464_c2_g1_i1.p1 TRINITY_DN1464_c2_g1~~TRINITY_DN1464_c2_g1_i1.p1  ORF type:complete len:403 (+),score=41.48 TRINITY_DN1464_c2_g1_i1:65-1273(+)
MLMLASFAFVHLAFAAKTESSPRLVHKYAGPGCNAAALTDSWTIISATSNDLISCTIASHSTPSSSSSSPVHVIDDLSLARKQHGLEALSKAGLEALHMICVNGIARFGAYHYDGSAIPSCSVTRVEETFDTAQHNLFIAGSCANTVGGNSIEIDIAGLTLPACTVAATGDPHLTNLRGHKFDIHDGLHRFVHYPRDAPEEEALLKIDAQAVDVGPEADCYSVFLQNIKLSGKWVGDDITLSTNTSVASADPSAFSMSFASQKMDWPALSKQHNGHLELKGIAPFSVAASTRNNTTDTMGGEEISFKFGDRSPVFVQVWSSHGQNWITHEKDVRFLNVDVKNLPKDSGGILGLDSYVKPSSSRCGLVQEERDLADFIGADMSLLRLRNAKKPQWTASVTMQQ